MIKDEIEKEISWNIQLTTDWKWTSWEKCRSQLPLEMLGICSSLRDQQFWFLNRMISSSYERDMIKTSKRKLLKNWCGKWSVLQKLHKCGGKEVCLKGGKRRDFPSESHAATSAPHGGRVEPMGAEGSLARGAHGLPHGLAKWPHVICTSLARSLGSLPHILSIRPPISNPFSDYEPRLPHARLRLLNFEKWLRNHLGIRRWNQHNKWERKVA